MRLHVLYEQHPELFQWTDSALRPRVYAYDGYGWISRSSDKDTPYDAEIIDAEEVRAMVEFEMRVRLIHGGHRITTWYDPVDRRSRMKITRGHAVRESAETWRLLIYAYKCMREGKPLDAKLIGVTL